MTFNSYSFLEDKVHLGFHDKSAKASFIFIIGKFVGSVQYILVQLLINIPHK